MKTIKKLTALMLSLVMMLALGVTAFAEANGNASTGTTYTITAPDTNHQYEIYQIFTGDLSTDKTVLSNVKWGINGKGTTGQAVDEAILSELKGKNSSSDKEILAVVEKYVDLSSEPVKTIANGAIYNAAAGYYLIKDKDGSVSGKDSYTTYIVKVVDNVKITPKSAIPNFEKKIKDTNDTTGETSDWQDSADYDIGDQVPFKLKGTVAANYDQYTHYYFAFHDKEESGFTFNQDSVAVFVDDKQIVNGFAVLTGESKVDSECTFEVVFEDLKKIDDVKAGSEITVTYTSELNSTANIGSEGNVNKAKLVFSNNPNDTQFGRPEKPGETQWDNVIAFTYKVVVNKYANSVDPDDLSKNKLAGAEFTLEKVLNDGSKKTITVVNSMDGTSFTFKGLDDGDYILTETKTPNEYNTIAPITFTVTADHAITWEGEARNVILTSLTGNTTSGEITFTANEDKSELATNVINKKGSTLPSTGGMGTTIFYVVGTILVLAAVVLLITKKRMHADK